MYVDFYKTTDDTRKIGKTVSEKKTVNAIFVYDSISILNPVFILRYDADIFEKNIFYCDTLKRWYSISSIQLQSAEKMVVSGAVDVLQTYSDEILKCKAQAVRATAPGLNEMTDTAFPIVPGSEFVTSVYLSDTDIDPPETPPEEVYRFVLALKK